LRLYQPVNDARGRKELVIRVLGIDPALNGPAPEAHVTLTQSQPFTGRNPELFPDQVETGDHFGYGVFNLKPGVHLEEVEIPVFVQKNSTVPAFS
jgi:hypothetical protein